MFVLKHPEANMNRIGCKFASLFARGRSFRNSWLVDPQKQKLLLTNRGPIASPNPKPMSPNRCSMDSTPKTLANKSWPHRPSKPKILANKSWPHLPWTVKTLGNKSRPYPPWTPKTPVNKPWPQSPKLRVTDRGPIHPQHPKHL